MKNKIMKMYQDVGLVDEENEEIIAFGLTRFFDIMANWIFAIVCAGLMGNLLVGFFFEVSYMLLRSFVGGYHADSKKSCLYLTYFSTFVCIAMIFLVPIRRIAMCIIMLFFNLIILLFAPIQNENKPLNSVEKKVYRKKSFSISIVETGVFYLLMLVNLSMYSKVIFFSTLLVIAGMVADLIKKRFAGAIYK